MPSLPPYNTRSLLRGGVEAGRDQHVLARRRQAGLPPRSGVLVHDALADGLVDHCTRERGRERGEQEGLGSWGASHAEHQGTPQRSHTARPPAACPCCLVQGVQVCREGQRTMPIRAQSAQPRAGPDGWPVRVRSSPRRNACSIRCKNRAAPLPAALSAQEQCSSLHYVCSISLHPPW